MYQEETNKEKSFWFLDILAILIIIILLYLIFRTYQNYEKRSKCEEGVSIVDIY